jgi:integrase
MSSKFVEQCSESRWRIRLPKGLHGLPKRTEIYVDRLGRPFYHPDEAEEALIEILGEMKVQGARFDPGQYSIKHKSVRSFGAYLDDWLANQQRRMERGQIRPTYLRDVRQFCNRYFKPGLGNLDFNQIRGKELTALYLDLDVGPKTVRNVMGVLKKIFNDAEREEVITRVPRFPLTARPPRVSRDWLTEEEQQKIFDLLAPEDFYFVFFLAKHATRVGEGRALQHRDINLKQESVSISRAFSGKDSLYPPKTGASREIPLDPEWAELYRARPRHIDPEGFAFLRHGKPLSVTWTSIQWKKAAVAAGFPNISLYHGTRRSWASQAASRGESVSLVAAWLGDSVATTEKHYAFVRGVDSLRKIGSHAQTTPTKIGGSNE